MLSVPRVGVPSHHLDVALDSLSQCDGDLVLPFLISVHNYTMRGQRCHGSPGRFFRYNMYCWKIGLLMGRHPVREEDNGAMDDLMKS
jgi:hypothetical protein